MTVQFIDPSAPRFTGTLPPRPTVLRAPQEVLDAVAREEAKFPPEIFTSQARKRITDDLTLQYYFERYDGIDVAYRSVAEGIEVLAVGLKEVGELAKGMSQEELLTIQIKQP
jgi:hypothetical protein